MFRIIRESFNITNEYIILGTPLILFSLISSLYLMFSSSGNLISILFTVILFFLMLGAFLSGWFYMITTAVKDTEKEHRDSLIAEFPAGVGEYFLSVLGLIFNVFVVSSFIIIAVVLIGKHYIGNPELTQSQLSSAFTDIESMKTFINALTPEQISKINLWNSLLMIGMTLNYFIIMFYAPALLLKNKNPFLAFFISIKDLFTRYFFQNVFLFLIIAFTYFVLTLFTALFSKNIFAHFIFTLLGFYYYTYILVLLFNYYYSRYTKVGSNIDATV